MAKKVMDKSLKLDFSVSKEAFKLLSIIDVDGYLGLNDQRYVIVIRPEDFSNYVGDEASYFTALRDLRIAALKLLDVKVIFENGFTTWNGFINLFSWVDTDCNRGSVYIKPSIEGLTWFSTNRALIFGEQTKAKDNIFEIHELKLSPLNPFEDH